MLKFLLNHNSSYSGSQYYLLIIEIARTIREGTHLNQEPRNTNTFMLLIPKTAEVGSITKSKKGENGQKKLFLSVRPL